MIETPTDLFSCRCRRSRYWPDNPRFSFGRRSLPQTASNKGLFISKKDYKGAEVAFRKVISDMTVMYMVHLLLGNVLMQQRLEEEAIPVQEVIRLAPKNADAHLIGDVLIKQKQFRRGDHNP